MDLPSSVLGSAYVMAPPPTVPRSTTDAAIRPGWLPWFLPALVATAVVDLASKAWIFARYPEGARFSWWGEIAYNTGVAWGLFGDYPLGVLALTLLLIPVLVLVWWRQFRHEGRGANLAFGLILGGAVGNGYDRVMMGIHQHALAEARSGPADASAPLPGLQGVRDFIRIDLNMVGIDYIWPNFNIADAAISLGFIILVALMLFAPGRTAAPRAVERAST
jgi:lipoprotein signal peptidase